MLRALWVGLAAFALDAHAAGAIEPARLAALVQQARDTHSSALVLMHRGKLVAEHYFDQPREPIEAMSVTKSVMNLAIGRLIAEGRIASLDVPLHAWFPEWKQGRKQAITLRMLMNHSSGIQNVRDTGVEIYPSPDFVQLALAAELSDAPGEKYAYNNKTLNLVPEIVRRVSGQRIDEWLRAGLFKELGITDFTWSLDDTGHAHGMSGLQIHPADLAKLGQLMLQDGRWNGRALLPADWTALSTRAHAPAPDGTGLLWFTTPRSLRHTLDAAQFDALLAAGVDAAFVERLRPHRGTYEEADWRGMLERALGADYLQIANAAIAPARKAGLTLGRRERIGLKGYSGRGYLGQYVVVFPAQELVAVRMIRYDRYDQARAPADDFGEFEPMVFALFDPPAKNASAR